MEVQFGPNSADEPNLLYKLQRKIKVFNTNNSLANRGYNLVACTSKYGIVFIASPNGMLSVYYLKELIDKESDAQHLLLKLQVSPTHIAVNCNQEWLAVIGGQMLLVYKCVDFQNPEIRPAVTIKCDVNPSTFVSSLQWNPCIPDTIGIVYFDGTLLVSQVSNMQVKKIQSNARCLCWSPKGKQLVTGNTDGTLTQYKPDLSQMKMVPTPRLFEGAPVEAMAIYWIATYQFAVTYKNAADNSRPAVTIVNTPKGGAPTCINYEDICYSMGSNRPWYYYLQGISHWNLILTSSSNSMEIATLATMDGSNWVQWCQPDEARPELPLTDKKQENYPVGICIDTAAIHQLPWGENQTLPPMPLLHVVSQTGWLSIFNVINLNKSAQQLCSPTQPLLLPNTALTSNIPDDVPAQPQQPSGPTAQPKQPPQMQTMQQQLQQPTVHQPQMQQQLKQPQPQQPALPPQPQIQQPTPIAPKPVPQTPNSAFQPASQPYGVKKETTPVTTETPTSMPQPKATVQVPKPQPVEVTAAMKLEQERISKAKANQELKKMLIKEVNDFQMELYKFMKMTQERQEKLQQELQSANLTTEIDMDAEKLRKECSMEDLRETVIQLKLELVRTCAAVAEARAHAEAKDQREWTQMDPLTAKRIASVKKLSYYVQNQLDQAQKALDHKWNEMIARDEYSKPGDRMIRPILDEVYQPLVKQQEIISKQQAMIKTLKNTMKECNITPTFRSSSLLRNTPFKNKDPLSKLTKNILNMSIEPQNKAKEQLLSSQKLDALRDVLSNHKPIKIKPVSVEVTQHLENMKKKYEQSVRERELKEEALNASAKEVKVPEIKEQKPSFPQMPVKQEPKFVTPSFSQVVPQVTPNLLKNEGNAFKGPIGGIPTYGFTQPAVLEAKSDIVKESPIRTPSYNFKPAVPVARTLFADEPKEEKQVEATPKPVPALQQPTAEQKMNASQNTKSLLRQYILRDSNESASQNNDNKNDSNTFMGQNICSPTAFGIAKPQATAAPSAVFASKPITDMANMFSKFQTEEPASTGTFKPPNDETGESETAGPKEKPITNMFSLKTSTPLVSKNQNVPDVIKGGQGFVFSKTDKGFVKTKAEENLEKSKENVPDKDGDNQKAMDKKEDLKPSVAPMTSKAPAQSVIIVDLKKPAAEAKIEKVPSSIFGSAPTSPPPTVSKPQQGFLAISTPDSTKTTESTTTTDNKTNTTSAPKSPVSEDKNTTSVTITIPKPKETESAKDNKIDTQAEYLSETKTPPVTSTSTAPTSVESKPTVLTTPTPASNASQSVFSPNSSIFSSNFETQTTQGSIFGTQTQAQSIFTTQTPQATTTSVFGTSSAQSLFSAAASKSMFASTKSAFGTTTTTTQSSIFGSSPVFGTSQSTPSQVFGTSTQGSIFGNTTTTQASVFGNQTQTTQASVFGTQTSQASIFGSPTQTASPSIFGSATSTTQASVFGSPTQTSPASVFGAQSQTTQASVFGTPTQTTQASVFGTPTQTTQASVFGTPTQASQASVFGTPTQTTQASIFGTPTQTTQASVFGTPTQTTQASIFGTPTQTTQASVFGTPTTTVQSGSLFGGGETDLFASASISTTNAPTQASGGSIFGSSSGSVFGSSNTNVFGGKASFTGSNPTASNIFSGGGATTFGQKPATDFWSGGNTNSGFGSTGFGQQPTTQSSSMFGTSGGSFSTPNAQPFGSPQPFSGENKPSVFGSPQQQSAPAFGGSPVFGSKPVFGGSPGFGQPAFGGFNKSPSSGFGAPASFGTGGFGASAFGNTSPGKMFGNNTPNFGPPTQSNSTFETLATQNTLTFGNLAQQSGPPAPAAPAFNTSPSFTGWRG